MASIDSTGEFVPLHFDKCLVFVFDDKNGEREREKDRERERKRKKKRVRDERNTSTMCIAHMNFRFVQFVRTVDKKVHRQKKRTKVNIKTKRIEDHYSSWKLYMNGHKVHDKKNLPKLTLISWINTGIYLYSKKYYFLLSIARQSLMLYNFKFLFFLPQPNASILTLLGTVEKKIMNKLHLIDNINGI